MTMAVKHKHPGVVFIDQHKRQCLVVTRLHHPMGHGPNFGRRPFLAKVNGLDLRQNWRVQRHQHHNAGPDGCAQNQRSGHSRTTPSPALWAVE